MSGAVAIRAFAAGDAVQLALQPSQHVTLGLTKAIHSLEDGRELADLGPAWTAIGRGAAGPVRILACYGFVVAAPAGPNTGGHALAWALLASGLGRAHLAITRFARRAIADSGFTRIEALVRADIAAEVKWAELVGFDLAATLRGYGPGGETHLLFEKVRPFVAAPLQEAA